MRRSRLFPERRATAAVEMALISPLVLILLAGIIDFGRMLHDKLKLASVVASAGEYALLSAASINSGNGATLAATLGGIVANSNGAAWAGAAVTVNAGPSSVVANGATTPSGTAANADRCWCPTGNPGSWAWGAAATCGTACAGGTLAGKFVSVTGSRSFSAIFGHYGLISDRVLRENTIVQAQ